MISIFRVRLIYCHTASPPERALIQHGTEITHTHTHVPANLHSKIITKKKRGRKGLSSVVDNCELTPLALSILYGLSDRNNKLRQVFWQARGSFPVPWLPSVPPTRLFARETAVLILVKQILKTWGFLTSQNTATWLTQSNGLLY